MGIIGLTIGLILWIPCVILMLFMIGGLVTGSCFSEYDITGNAISCTFGQIIVAVVLVIPSVIGGLFLLANFGGSSDEKSTFTETRKSANLLPNRSPKNIKDTQPVLPKGFNKSSKVKSTSQDIALEILKTRLTSGEITIDEFNKLKSVVNE